MNADRISRLTFTCALLVIAISGCLSYPAPQNASTPSSGGSVGTSSGASAIENATLSMINAERGKKGLAPLVMRDDLHRVARAHSEDMAARDFHDHTNPDGESPWDRMRAAGITFSSSAENIAWNDHPDQAAVAVRSWMESRGHRDNILNGGYTLTGLGVASDGAGGAYFTQVFMSE